MLSLVNVWKVTFGWSFLGPGSVFVMQVLEHFWSVLYFLPQKVQGCYTIRLHNCIRGPVLLVLFDALVGSAVFLLDRGEMLLVLEIVESRLWFDRDISWGQPIGKLELMNKRPAESAFVALATEYNNLMSHLIVWHPKVIPSRFLRRKTRLSQRSPNSLLEIKKAEVSKRFSRCWKTSIHYQVISLTLMTSIELSNQTALMAISPFRLPPIYRIHHLKCCHIMLNKLLWQKWAIHLFDIRVNNPSLLLNNNEIIRGYFGLANRVIDFATEYEMSIINQLKLQFIILRHLIFLNTIYLYFDRI